MPSLPENRAAPQCGWETHKEALRKLYLVEKKTLKEVGEFMAQSNNFKATESQYEHIFREWGFEKNLKKSDWIAIDHHTSKRKREGKENEVLHNGIVVPPRKVRKEILRNRRAPSPRREGAPSPELPKGVTIRTPAVSPRAPAAVLEWSTLSVAADDNIFGVTDRFASQPASQRPRNQISESAHQELWPGSYGSGENFRSELQGTAGDPVQSLPQRCSSSEYFNELLFDRGLDLGLQEFTFLENLESFDTSCNIMDLGWSSSPTGASDILRNTSNHTPFTKQDYLSISNWGGRHSRVLYNVPWFRFQHLATGSFSSGANIDHHAQALHSPLHRLEHSQVQHSIALEDRQRLLSGLFVSATAPNSMQSLPNFKSLLQGSVPERFEGDIENKLQHFFDPVNKCSLYQLTEFHLYFLSNNKFTKAQADNLLGFIAKQKPLGPLKSFLQMKAPTIQVFCERFLEFTIRHGDVATLQLLIDCGVDKSALSGARGGKYLQIALVYDNLDIAEYLLGNGVDVNPPLGEFPHSKPPLHTAIAEGYSKMVKLLIDAGANVNRRCANGETALGDGIRGGDKSTDCLRLLLEGGANVDGSKMDDLLLLDWVYLNKRELYSMILSRSQRAKRSLTTSGVLYAANASRQALSQYLNSMPPIEDWQRRNILESALCEAVGSSDQPLEVVCILLEFGVDPNVSTVCGKTPPLVLAAMTNDIDLAEILLDAGADINTPDVLETAADNDENFDILNFLIEEGADVKTFGAGALRNAGFGNNLAIVKLLLSSGADINYPAAPEVGRTLLQRAVWFGDLKAIRYLIDQGADINAPASHSYGGTALQTAAIRGNMAAIKLLLTLGADVNSAPSRRDGKTALEAAASCERPPERAELFQLLLDQGATINRPQAQRRYRNWISALTRLVKYSSGEDLIRSALSAGADINELGHGKGARTPIQAAAEIGNIAVVQLLLDNGANIDAPPGREYGRTALQAACSTKAPNIELVKFLLDNGADANAPAGLKQGLTALQGAAIQGHIQIALMLLDADVEVNAEPAAIDGRTALDGAAEHGRLDMVQLLLNLGAESEEPGATGFDKTIELAEKYNHSAIVDLLRDHL